MESTLRMAEIEQNAALSIKSLQLQLSDLEASSKVWDISLGERETAIFELRTELDSVRSERDARITEEAFRSA